LRVKQNSVKDIVFGRRDFRGNIDHITFHEILKSCGRGHPGRSLAYLSQLRNSLWRAFLCHVLPFYFQVDPGRYCMSGRPLCFISSDYTKTSSLSNAMNSSIGILRMLVQAHSVCSPIEGGGKRGSAGVSDSLNGIV
jgi:hypothetical protein